MLLESFCTGCISVFPNVRVVGQEIASARHNCSPELFDGFNDPSEKYFIHKEMSPLRLKCYRWSRE